MPKLLSDSHSGSQTLKLHTQIPKLYTILVQNSCHSSLADVALQRGTNMWVRSL